MWEYHTPSWRYVCIRYAVLALTLVSESAAAFVVYVPIRVRREVFVTPILVILSSPLWPLASCMVLLCVALRPFFTAFRLCWLPSFLCWSHSLLPQGLCIRSSLCLPCSSFPRVVFFCRSLFTLLYRVTFSKRPPWVRPQAPSCHRSYPLAFFFIILLPLPRIPSSVCMCHKRREGREFVSLASSLLRLCHLQRTYTGVC